MDFEHALSLKKERKVISRLRKVASPLAVAKMCSIQGGSSTRKLKDKSYKQSWDNVGLIKNTRQSLQPI